MRRVLLAAGVMLLALWVSLTAQFVIVQEPANAVPQATQLLLEPFENSSFTARGWYDTTGGVISSAEHIVGNGSLQCAFASSATNCTGGDVGRYLFTPTESVYMAYYVKHTTNWVGSGLAYHPHIFYFLSSLDGAFDGPAYNYLTAYVENHMTSGGIPYFAIQDGKNIDENNIGVNLVGVTENRAVAGCNGDSDGYGNTDCYVSGSPTPTSHWNAKFWPVTGSNYFGSTSPFNKNAWHLVEMYWRLNSVNSMGIGQTDGVVQMWYDGTEILSHSNVQFRTGQRSTMKVNQVFMSPYIGDGSPAAQTMWIDQLQIWTARPTPSPTVPVALTSLTPSTGAVGSSVVIAGVGFGSNQGSGTVTFNGVTATATAWSATSITATVPSTTTGSVIVTQNSLASNALTFTVTASGPPVIFSTSFTVAQGWTVDRIDSASGGFGSCGGAGFNGVQTYVNEFADQATSSGPPAGCDRVVTAANYSGGGGGRGFQHKKNNGTNDQGGALLIGTLPGSPRNLYYRYYMQLESGLTISGGSSPHKMIYFSGARCDGNGGGCYPGMSSGQTRFTVSGGNFEASSTGGANNVDFRDNQWHRIEIHVDARGGAGAGIVTIKAGNAADNPASDITLLNETAVTFGGSGAGFTEFEFPSNGAFGCTSNPCNENLDDLAISTVDWIGPYNAGRGY